MRGVFLAIALLICAQAPRVAAQPQSDTQLKRESGVLLPSPIDGQGAPKGLPTRGYQGPPLYIQTDTLVYDDKKNRVIAQGNVEIYFKNYILTADKVVYDRGANTLVAEGNAQLKDPDGSITRADRLEASGDFRDAFAKSLSHVLGPEFNDRSLTKRQTPVPQ